MNKSRTCSLLMASMSVAVALAFSMPGPARSEEAVSAAASASAPGQPAQQIAYSGPELAFDEFVGALKAGDGKMVAAILGAGSDALVRSGDPVEDGQRARNFVRAYAEKHSVIRDGNGRASLVLGNDAWVMPIPAVREARGWTLDAAAAARQILARNIGQNELSAIEVARGIVDAQREYASESHDASGLRAYAARFNSSKGRHDGLYWKTRPGEPFSPLGPFVAQAASEGYGKTGPGAPYHGYYFRLLTAQGNDAPEGARSYLVNGRLLAGFALVAYPAQVGSSGIMTFVVNQDGVVHEKALGPNTAVAAKAITAYNPDASWTPVGVASLPPREDR